MSKITRVIMIVIMFGTIALAVYNARFTRPTADDYTYTQITQGKHVFEFISEQYQIWTGRFTSQFWYSIVYRMLGPRATATEYRYYRLWPLFIIGILITSMYCYARFLLNRNRDLVTRRARDAIYLTATILFLYMLPVRVGATWYNISVSVVYQLGGAHFLLNVILLCAFAQRMREDDARRWRCANTLRMVAIALSTFCLAGYNESLALVSALFCGMGLLWAILHDKKQISLWVIVIVAAAIGGVVSYAAPGNGQRLEIIASASARSHALLLQGGRFFAQSVYGLARFFGAMGVATVVLCAFPFTRRYLSLYTRLFDRFAASSRALFRRMVIVAYPLMVLCALAPPIYSIGGVGPPRLHVLLHFFLVVGFGLFWANARTTRIYRKTSEYFARLRGYRNIHIGMILMAFSGVFFITATSIALQFDSFQNTLPIAAHTTKRVENLFPATVYNTFRDAFYGGSRYREAGIRFISTLQNAAADTEITVAPLCPIAKSLVSYDEALSSDSFGYPNGAFAFAFNLDALRLNTNLYCYNRNRLIWR